MFFFSQLFLNLDEKPDRLIVHLQETIALILPWSRSTKITLLFAILFWTRFGTYNNDTIDCHLLLDKIWDSPDVTINAPVCKVMVGLVQESHNFLPVFAEISLFMQVLTIWPGLSSKAHRTERKYC